MGVASSLSNNFVSQQGCLTTRLFDHPPDSGAALAATHTWDHAGMAGGLRPRTQAGKEGDGCET